MADQNIDKILGQIFYRAKIGHKSEYSDKDYQDVGKELLNAKMGSVYGTVFFYSKVLKRLNPTLSIYFLDSIQTLQEWSKELEAEKKVFGQNLETYTDGTMS
jgi:hypothetical protein